MKKNCRTCRYYRNKTGFCNYYRDNIPVILDDRCDVWVKKDALLY
jgi:hypothetical protein